MKPKIFSALFLLCLLGMLLQPGPVRGDAPHLLYAPLAVNGSMTGYGRWEPALKWAYGGCHFGWCETAWYNSPATADINGDGREEILASAYTRFALDGQTGKTLWQTAYDYRGWPSLALADIDRDGQKEIVAAQEKGLVTVYRLDGSLKWQKTLYERDNSGKELPQDAGEFRGLMLSDLNGDGKLEIIVGRAVPKTRSIWVLDVAGNILPGWPQLPVDDGDVTPGYGHMGGVYNSDLAAYDFNGDGKKELVIPSDTHYLGMLRSDGSGVPVNSAIFHHLKPADTLYTWPNTGVWEDPAIELKGGGACGGERKERYRPRFADNGAVIADFNGDGTREIAVTGNVYDCFYWDPPGKYTGLYLFNPDRTRFNSAGYDWRDVPKDIGAPLSEDYHTIETAEASPVAADLDRDGKKEILFPAYDGKLHAFWLDKSEHGAWPYAVTQPGEGVIRFASEPLVADLFNDGRVEVIFTDWTQKGSYKNGRLHILDGLGAPIYTAELPPAREAGGTWDGALGAPTLANVDSDPDLELIVNTAHAGVVVYDLPSTAQARILWGTGRGSYTRDGVK